MKLTTRSEYSILALIYIARHQEKDAFVKAEDICKHYGLPKKYLEVMLLTLKQNRILKTKRGANGGYQLAVPAKKITLAKIVRMMDGALAPSEAVSQYFFTDTAIRKEKKILHVLKDVRDYVVKKLDSTTLEDLI